jgi:hypothetical protein
MTQNKTNKAEWGERLCIFIQKYNYEQLYCGGVIHRKLNSLIKSFIHQTLSSERQRLIEKIEGMKVPIDEVYDKWEKKMMKTIGMSEKTPEYLREMHRGYNYALTDILSAIRKEEE